MRQAEMLRFVARFAGVEPRACACAGPPPPPAGFLGTNFADQPLWKRLNWLHVPLLVGTPIVGIYGLLTAKFYWQTWLFTYCFYLFSGFGITAGYHRLWAHRSYRAHPILEFILLVAGTSAVEGSVRWWARDHRAHHR